MRLRRATLVVVPSLLALSTATAVVTSVNAAYCAQLPGYEKGTALFDAAVAERAAVAAVESDPPVLVWLEPSPATHLWLRDVQRCDGHTELRVLYRDEASRAAIRQRIDGSRLRELEPARMDRG